MKSSALSKGIVGLIAITGFIAFAQAPTEASKTPKPASSVPRPPNASKSKLWLITREEASVVNDLYRRNKTPNFPQEIPRMLIGFKMFRDDGPEFDVRKPTQRIVKSPFEIDIKFSPREGEVDLQTLRIDAQMFVSGAFRGHWDLVPRLKSFVSPSGIVTPPVSIPSGTYRIELALRDKRGGESSGELIMRVAPRL
jgi:hypothetical protein